MKKVLRLPIPRTTKPGKLIPMAPAIVAPRELRATGLRLRDGLSLGKWQALGKRLRQIERGRLWWLGDWAVYGEGRYGSKYAEALAETDCCYQTVANAKYVSQRTEFSRRREDLSWSHHAEVAGLDPTEADRWLARAANEHWSQKVLRAEIAAAATRRLLEEDTAAAVITEPPIESGIDSQQEIENPTTEAPDDDHRTEEEEAVRDEENAPAGDSWLRIENTIAMLQSDADELRQVNVALLARHPDATQLLDRLGDALSVLNRFRDALTQAITNQAAADRATPHNAEEEKHG